MAGSRLLVVALLAAACDTSDKSAELEQRVETLEKKLAQDQEKTGDPAAKLDQRVGSLEERLAKTEHDLVAGSETDAKLRASIEELQALTEKLGADAALATTGGGTVELVEDLKIGVPECDEYMAKYSRCIEDKIPEAAREVSLKALRTSAEAWRKAAATEAGREALAQACKTATEAVAASCGF